jgi:hypothetical protein
MNFVVEDDRPSDSPFVEMIWRTQSGSEGSFISRAAIHWELVIAKHQGKTTVIMHGPETKATRAFVPADTEWLGIAFKLGTFMPHLPVSGLLDRSTAELPEAANKAFWLNGSTWEVPTYENADTFVMRLVREELLVHDPVAGAVLQGQPQAFSPRALQYRFVRATGLSYKLIQQIERAKKAAMLLENGMSVSDTVRETGYFDHGHLTNSLKRFVGQTPTQIAHTNTIK